VTRLLAALVVLAALVAGSSAGAAREVARCSGAQLAGSFTAVRDSAGAGNITYALKLKNTSASACTVTGLPAGRLLGLHKGSLPTHVRAAFPGALTAILVTLAPGRSTRATARFSPDVPGTGEQMSGRCEPVAYWLRIAAQGGGSTTVKIVPPTSVCEHGRLLFSAYGLG
jgi:Domain of unknown function (DUF4232)